MPRKTHHTKRALACGFALLLALACGDPPPDLEDVRALQARGELQASIEPLRAILAEDPENAEASHLLGQTLVQLGRLSEAIWHLEKASSDPEVGDAALRALCASLLAMGNVEEVLRASERLVTRDPETPESWALRGEAGLGAKRPELALDAAGELLARDPASLAGLALRARALVELDRLDEAEAAWTAYEAAAADDLPETGASACLAVARFLANQREDLERAAAKLEGCEVRYAALPTFALGAAAVYDATGRSEEGTALVQRALEASPEDVRLRVQLAGRLHAAGQADRAEALVAEGAREQESAPLWEALADLRRTRGDLEGALAALDEADALVPADPERLAFLRTELLTEMGRLEEVERVLGTLSEPVYHDLAEARLLLERGDPAQALERLERALIQWPNNAGARMLAARAAHELGDEDRALAELREATRAAPTRTDAALLLARLLVVRGQPEEALSFINRHVKSRGAGSADLYLVAARAARAMGDRAAQRKTLEFLAEVPAYRALGIAQLAELGLEDGDPAAARRLVEGSGLDLAREENAVALRQLIRVDLAEGAPERALASLEALLADHPEAAHLLALRGQMRLRTGDLGGARSDFEAARRLAPEAADALAGEGELALLAGDPAGAAALLERAGAERPDHLYRAAQIYSLAGDASAAERVLGALLRTQPEHAGAANDLAWLLATRGADLEHAEALAQRAAQLSPSPETHDTLGFVQLRRGQLDAARETFERALDERPGYATARYHLALALVEAGELERARDELDAALAGGDFAEAEEARALRAELDTAG